MVNGRPLFPGSNNEDQLHRIFKVLGTPAATEGLMSLPQWRDNFKYYPPLKWKYIAPGLNELGLDLLSQMLAFEASERISAKRAMQHPYFDDLDPALKDPTRRALIVIAAAHAPAAAAATAALPAAVVTAAAAAAAAGQAAAAIAVAAAHAAADIAAAAATAAAFGAAPAAAAAKAAAAAAAAFATSLSKMWI
ncbi:hypothetical protein ACSSS7_006516 [Eimeria intestinalis]